ncbi:efflux RND transporter periplasmic adaptor subunit [Geothrix sp. PMB-07]|uniref:efflux RND transporter periplasmic adaptor subunit n=1 Tax=Geothrix sp. PMB-07 TaxID=3068640 RepID=UPI002742538E|nr:efflux RND transporter periplasmic adaptor subunit [Geothrix sp. PMB-07]WLT32530.1 efflux RND transporter periplasmic adaptor subunit [Geothrix sp. PMB-07]
MMLNRKAAGVLALSTLLLGALACGRREYHSEIKDLPKVAVTLVAGSSSESGNWLAATLQATRTANLSTRVGTQVKRVLAQEGQRVAAGSLLLVLGDEDLQAQLRAAETGLATVEAQHRRMTALFAQKAATTAEVEQTQAQLAQAQAGVASLKANIAYTQIRAPFAGVVQARKVNEGDFVGPGMPLIELVGEGEQEWVATFSEAEGRLLKAGQKIRFESEGTAGEAQVTALSPGGDAFSHKGTLRARVLKPKDLRQGAFGRLLLSGAKSEDLMVPRSALVLRGELTGVFLAKEGRTELRWITLGEGSGNSLPVRSGLKAEDRVIDRPGSLQDGQPIDIKQGGVSHVH